MLLSRLAEYTRNRLGKQPAMYEPRPVKWLVDIDEAGNFLGIAPLSDGRGGRNDRGKLMDLPHVMKSSGIKAKLLSDSAEYVLGLSDTDERQERAQKCHQAFVGLLEDCEKKTKEKSIRAILSFYKSGGLPRGEIERNGIQSKEEVTFRVASNYPFKMSVVKGYWETKNTEDIDSKGQCIVCAGEGSVLQRIPHKIKRVPNGQSAGNSIISANADPFESYGLKNSLIAPTCPKCAEDFSRALNTLLADKSSNIRVGPSVYVFWTKEESDFTIGNYFQEPEPDEVRELIRSVRTAQAGSLGFDETDFYAVSLSSILIFCFLKSLIF